MKKLGIVMPLLVGLTAVVFMAVGAALIYPPAGWIVAGAALYLDLQLDKVRPS
jgi:hypothetical protein